MMTTTSRKSDSTEGVRVLAFLQAQRPVPEHVAAGVAELRPVGEAGDGAAMLAALGGARQRWEAFPLAQRLVSESDEPSHLTHWWCDLQEMVARAPARCLPAMLAKARLAAWHWHKCGGDWAAWQSELARTLQEGMAGVAADAGAPARGPA